MTTILRNKKWIIAFLVIVIGALVTWRFLKPSSMPDGFASGNGRLEATETAVATKVQGKLLQVLFRDGADLKEGETAAILDDAQIKADIQAAEAAVIQAQEALSVAKENVKSMQSQQALAAVTLKRTEELIKKGFISAATLDKDLNAIRVANANLTSARNKVLEAQATVKEKIAKVASLKSNLDDLTLKAPVNGRVLYRLAEPGEVLSPGGKVFSLLDMNDVYMYIYLSSSDAGNVAIGSEARIILDALPDTPIPCSVVYVSPRNQFTPKEVETKDEREKFMFRVKLKVDPEWISTHGAMTKPGMPGMGWVKTQADAIWPSNLQVK